MPDLLVTVWHACGHFISIAIREGRQSLIARVSQCAIDGKAPGLAEHIGHSGGFRGQRRRALGQSRRGDIDLQLAGGHLQSQRAEQVAHGQAFAESAGV
ncbi:MAG: hypothetical protein ACYC35_11790 [Pirellulales bacterium]